MNCSPFSIRDPSGDRSCGETVPSGSSGFCLCEDGKRTAYSDCHHPSFSCSQECAKLPRRRCPLLNSTLYSSSGTGCLGVMELQNRVNDEVSVVLVDSLGVDTPLSTIPKGGSYTV